MAIARKVEEQTGVVCLGIWIHRDEGHARSRFHPDEPYQCNNHIHILWDCQNPITGKAIPIKKQDLRDMQDIAANALRMERGNPAELTKKKHIESGTYKVQQLEEEIKQLKKEKTGLVAKIQDAWKWKGRANQAEADLEAERKAHKEDIAKASRIIAEAKKTAENAEKRANKAEFRESNLREENNKLYQENKRLSVVARHWKDQYDETQGKKLKPDEPNRGRGR
jgi:chromosome segregation ATPase